jgi:hypothetical protein
MAEVTTNAAQIIRRFNALPSAMQGGIVRSVGRALLLTREKVRSNSQAKARRGARGLFGRLTSYAKPDRQIGLDAAIGFRRSKGFPYELSQEFGAHARPGKAMAIPLSYKAKRLSEGGVGPRGFPGKLFIPPNMHVLAESYKRGGGIKEIHYALVKSIAPRLHFFRTLNAELANLSSAIEAGAQEGASKI